MFEATFLGHHGWLFEAARGRLLVDPLFGARFGFTDAVELRAFPPRAFDFAAMPPVDAVLLTHEHEGHFDPASLALIDRRVPIYLSSRSSLAMGRLLDEMGFTTRPMSAGNPFAVGDLEVLPMTADQVRHGVIEEWDVLPYLVKDRAGDGNFFTSVDMLPDDAMWKAARRFVDRPGLWATTNNASQWAFLTDFLPVDHDALGRYVGEALAYHRRLCARWATPAALLVVGGGFAFGGPLAWLNANVFTCETSAAAEALALLRPHETVVAPTPGRKMVMSRGSLVDRDARSPFVATLPESEWPSRRFVGDVTWLASYEPCCGRRELGPGGLEDLQAELRSFAAHLYARDQFRRLYSLTEVGTAGHAPTFALALRDGDGAYVFEYRPQACSFEPVDCDDPVRDYLAVFECWATDLLASLRAEISTTALNFARCRMRNAAPHAFGFNLVHSIFEYAHPLRHPERFLALYRSTLARVPAAAPLVRFAGTGR